MPDFLLGIEYNLDTTLLAAGISFMLATILVWIMMVLANKSQLRKLRSELETKITALEQQRSQLDADLNSLQQTVQQTETKVTEQTAQIAQLEKDKQAAHLEAQRALALESSLNDQTQKVTELSQRLQEFDQLKQDLQRNLAEKETAVSTLTNTITEQAARILEVEKSLQAQQTEFAEAQQATIAQQQQLNETLLQLQQAKQQLAEQAAKIVTSSEQQQKNSTLEVNLRNLEKKLTDSESVIQELQAALAKKTTETIPQKPFKTSESPKPAQTQPEEKLPPKENAQKKTGVMGFFKKLDQQAEQIAPAPAESTHVSESPKPAQIQPEEKLPPKENAQKKTGVMGFFKKLDQQAEEIAAAPAESTHVSESPKPAQTQPEEQLPPKEKTQKKSGVMGFFKNLDQQAEQIAAAPAESTHVSESPKPAQTQSEEQQPPKEKAQKKTGVMGFFKKLDQQSEQIAPPESDALKSEKNVSEQEIPAEAKNGLKGIYQKIRAKKQ